MDEILSYIESHTAGYLARLTRACAQPSISAHGEGITRMADLVAGMLRDLGFSVELVPGDGPPVVLGRMAGRGERTLLLYNHYDVQPVDPLDEWTTPPFEPAIRDGRFYARGAADNKGAIVSRICALEAYLAHRDTLPVNLVWVIEGEEETGSPHLGQFVARHADLLRGAYGCVWEAGGKDARDRYEIALGCKGLLYVELHAHGAAGDLHSALAAVVASPVWRLVWALNTLKGPDERVRIPGFYDDVRPISAAQRQALAEWDYPEQESRALYGIDQFLGSLSGDPLKERLVFGPTCNVDGIQAVERARLLLRVVPPGQHLPLGSGERAHTVVEAGDAHALVGAFERVQRPHQPPGGAADDGGERRVQVAGRPVGAQLDVQ